MWQVFYVYFHEIEDEENGQTFLSTLYISLCLIDLRRRSYVESSRVQVRVYSCTRILFFRYLSKKAIILARWLSTSGKVISTGMTFAWRALRRTKQRLDTFLGHSRATTYPPPCRSFSNVRNSLDKLFVQAASQWAKSRVFALFLNNNNSWIVINSTQIFVKHNFNDNTVWYISCLFNRCSIDSINKFIRQIVLFARFFKLILASHVYFIALKFFSNFINGRLISRK